MWNTANTDQELDIIVELMTYQGVSYVAENHQIWEEKFKDADYQIFLINDDGVEDIKKLLNHFNIPAYLDSDEITRIN